MDSLCLSWTVSDCLSHSVSVTEIFFSHINTFLDNFRAEHGRNIHGFGRNCPWDLSLSASSARAARDFVVPCPEPPPSQWISVIFFCFRLSSSCKFIYIPRKQHLWKVYLMEGHGNSDSSYCNRGIHKECSSQVIKLYLNFMNFLLSFSVQIWGVPTMIIGS